MKDRLQYLILGLGIFSFILLHGCNGSKKPDIVCEDIPLIFIDDIERENTDHANIFIDVSGSMANFICSENTPYKQVFTTLETDFKARFREKMKIFNFSNNVKSSNYALLDYYDINKADNIYTGSGTRLDLVLEKISKTTVNEISIIITDAEAEGTGAIRQRPFIGKLVSEIVKITDKGLSLKIIGIRSRWSGNILRPFYIFIIGSYEAVSIFPFFSNSDGFKSESIVISKELLKAKVDSLDFIDVECENVKFDKIESTCTIFAPNSPAKLQLAFKITLKTELSYFSLKEKLSPVYTLLTKRVSNDYPIESTNAEGIIKLENIRTEYDGKNYLKLCYDILPFNYRENAYVSHFRLQLGEDDLMLKLPSWINSWSTTRINDFTRTYYFEEIINALIEQGLLYHYSFQLFEFYMIL